MYNTTALIGKYCFVLDIEVHGVITGIQGRRHNLGELQLLFTVQLISDEGDMTETRITVPSQSVNVNMHSGGVEVEK